MVRDSTQVHGSNRLGSTCVSSTCREWVIYVEDQILVATIEVLYVDVDLVEQTTLDGDTPRLSSLPLQILVRQLRDKVSTLACMHILLIQGHVAIEARARVVTHLTIVGAQLQVVHPVILLHPLLVRDHPAGTSAPEVTPAGIL